MKKTFIAIIICIICCLLVPGCGAGKKDNDISDNGVMEIGYLTKKNTVMSKIGKLYIEEIKKYLDIDS